MYIKPENRDTRYPLWFIRYQCRIPFIQMQSVEDLMENGLPTSGDRHHDHAMQWEPIIVSLPVHRIAELWSNGANIKLVNRDDAPKIYKDISAHLFAWKEHMENSYHPVKPPYEDLLTFDQFANVIYEHAKFAYDQRFVDKHFKLSSSSAVGRRAMLNSIARSDDRRRENAEKGVLQLRNIEYHEAIPKYDPEAETTFIDYSGKNSEVVAPSRNSLGQFFKKGKN